MNQIELEERMYEQGRDRAALFFSNVEGKGRAAESPYAQRLFQQYVLPLADHLAEELGSVGHAGHRRAHIALMLGLDPQAVAFLAVRTALNLLMGGRDLNHRKVAYALGLAVHRELVLGQIETINPELFHTLARDLNRRQSRDDRHRIAVFTTQAKSAGITWNEWPVGARDQVGLYLLGLLEAIGFLEIGERQRTGRGFSDFRDVMLGIGVLSDIDAVKTYISETSPLFGPCVEAPLPWLGLAGGGFHTPRMQRAHRYAVKTAPIARQSVRNAAGKGVGWVAALNALQGTRWAVNAGVLAAVESLAAAGHELAGVTLPVDPPAPVRPEFLDTWDKAAQPTLPPEQAEAFAAWKVETRKWHEARKLRVSDYSRFYTTTRQARQFAGLPVQFVYFLDSRGRAYPLSTGLSPQGADIQKALLHFSESKSIMADDARKWFLIHGANKFGFDKATLEARADWHFDRRSEIVASANDPLACRWWLDADKPLQFLAWCMEYRDMEQRGRRDSALPVSMDGSCNGLQHFSAMLRDQIGGEATNLVNAAEMQDIYRRVAIAANARLIAAPADEARTWWLEHFATDGADWRTVVKRSVMTTPYGVTRATAAKYVASDYLSSAAPGMSPAKARKLGTYIMGHVWAAIGEVVVKSREAMQWLSKAAREIAKRGGEDSFIGWTTPDGFRATQAYFEQDVLRIRTLLHGETRIRVTQESSTPDVEKHATAMAPNFVHSMDATHMRMIAVQAHAEGITDMAMIHDDYGTHAANSERWFHLVREQFHELYEKHDPLAMLAAEYDYLPAPPAKGSLSLDGVLLSPYAFS